MIGKTLAHYRIVEKIGAGGMGEVWRATDSKLGRDVALKMLPPELADDPERLARFRREALVLASLNHPNIASIYGLEEDGKSRALVLELVEGPTLADHLQNGPLSPREALPLARQIAEALQAAHDSGVIHRDLKPENVKLTANGQVKVLDFGLAKAMDAPAAEAASGDLAQSPTISPAFSAQMTGANVILGTAGYMSPEQVRGQAADKRSDIWAFGVIVFEMLTGRRLFAGDTASDSLASVLKVEPSWKRLPPDTPRALVRLLRRCLQKNPDDRLHDIADARLEIVEALTAPEEPPAPEPVPARGGRAFGWTGLAIGALVALLGLWAPWRRDEPSRDLAPAKVVRFDFPLANVENLLGDAVDTALLDISREGDRIVFHSHREGGARLWVRDLASGEETALDTGWAVAPSFEPGGNRIGYMTRSSLCFIRERDRSGTVLTPVGNLRGATWTEDGRIVYTRFTDTGLTRYDPRTDVIDTLTVLEVDREVRSHRWPSMLPGDLGVLYTVSSESILSFDDAQVAVLDLRSMESHRLAEGSMARYARSGHLVWSRDGTLLAAPFDLESLRITGETVPVVHDVSTQPASGAAHFALSDDGTLVYLPGSGQGPWSTLEWVDRDGNAEPIETPRHLYQAVDISPDGSKLALDVDAANSNVWILDLERGDLSRVSTTGNNSDPVWSPDGRSVFFSSSRGGRVSIHRQRIDGSSDAERLTSPSSAHFVPHVSSDGKWLVSYTLAGKNGSIHARRLDTQDEGKLILDTDFGEGAPRISPDGKWLAYVSDATGRGEVYVTRFPDADGRWKVSTGGSGGWRNARIQWSPDGRALYWLAGDGEMMEATFRAEPSVRIGRPRALFRDVQYRHEFAVGPDGRFLMIRDEVPWQPDRVRVVLNWFEELRRLVPPDSDR